MRIPDKEYGIFEQPLLLAGVAGIGALLIVFLIRGALLKREVKLTRWIRLSRDTDPFLYWISICVEASAAFGLLGFVYLLSGWAH